MNGSGHQKKTAKAWLIAESCLAALVLLAFFIPERGLCEAQNDPETQAVMQAARDYLDAEVRVDYPAVYACFAPSSDYTRINSYEQYLADARLAQERVVKYRIIAITYITKNENRQISANIEKIAEVEVDVTFLQASTQHQSEINIGFIFFKEGGKWYKS